MRKLFFYLCAVLPESTCFLTVDAGIILQYQTAASTSNTVLSPDLEDVVVTGDEMAQGGGLAANAGGTWNWRSWDVGAATTSAAVANNDFWRWGFDVTSPSASVTLATMDIRLDRSGTGPDDFEILAFVNGGSEISIMTHDFNDSDSAVSFLGVSLASIPALATGDSLEFILAAFNSEGSIGTFDLETVDSGGTDPRSLRIEGTVALTVVPEPAGLMTMAAGIAGLAGYRARRRPG